MKTTTKAVAVTTALSGVLALGLVATQSDDAVAGKPGYEKVCRYRQGWSQ